MNGKDKNNSSNKNGKVNSEKAVEDNRSNDSNLEIDSSEMVQEDINVNDGADEQMLREEENNKLTNKRDEVKFIKGDHQNGDAKIDLGNIDGKSFTGMTKDELMKYANDPFWVRLRWIFFIAFWLIWAAMLIGAILIIVEAPKCAAPEPLPWYKRGPLLLFNSILSNDKDVVSAQKLQATGAIYQLPAELTYSVKDPAVEQQVENLIKQYQNSDVNIILDIIPNYVTKDSELMKNALVDETKRSAFIWIESQNVPNNWLSIKNGSAWTEIQSGNYVLSQFGDNLFDLHMNDTIVKEKLSENLCHLIKLGVKGFRFKNSKFFLLSKNIENEGPSSDPNYIHNEYGFWTHKQTTFQDDLGDILYEYLLVVKNASSSAFLSVAEDIVRPEVYQTRAGDLGIDLPMYGRFINVLSEPEGKKIEKELNNVINTVGNQTWLQWNFDDISNRSNIDPSAFALYISLLPGVPVISFNSTTQTNVSEYIYKKIEALRLSPSYMHGELRQYDSGELLAYSRIKSGNPGYFVVLNPTESTQTGNYSNLGLPIKMSVAIQSDNFNVTNIFEKSPVNIDALEVSPYSTLILTYVPIKSG